MTERDRTRKDDELHELLRRGDPAADGSEPRPDEIARMRRAVLAAAETPRRRHVVWAPALAAATVLLVAVTGWMLQRERTGNPAPPEVATTVPELPESPEAVDERPEDVDTPAEVATTLSPAVVTVASSHKPTRVSDSARTVRFTTAGGTRIVWVLDPNLDI